jgi:hypothetical protein
MNSSTPRFPRFRWLRGQDDPVGRLGQRQIVHRVRSGCSNQPADCAEALKRAALPTSTRTSAVVRRLSRVIPGAAHAGAGGARNRAISIRISWNICRGTATSAI